MTCIWISVKDVFPNWRICQPIIAKLELPYRIKVNPIYLISARIQILRFSYLNIYMSRIHNLDSVSLTALINLRHGCR